MQVIGLWGGGGPDIFFFVINLFRIGLYGLPGEAIASGGESVPVFLRKYIAICDFSWRLGPSVPPSESVHVDTLLILAFGTKN